MVAVPSGYYSRGGHDLNAKEIAVLTVEPSKHPKVTTLIDDCQRSGGEDWIFFAS